MRRFSSFVLLSATILWQSPAFFAQAGFAIERIEVNQAIGVQKNNALKFVAGKDTVIRVFLSQDVTVDPAQTNATFTRDAVMVTTLAPRSYDAPTRVVDFLCPNRTVCGDWAAGGYVFSVTVNGVAASTAGTQYNFVERGQLRLLAVPVKANYNGVITQVTTDPVLNAKWRTLGQFVKDTYPVSANKVQWTERPELDASDARFDLETDAGQLALWEALTNLMPPHCQVNPRAADCFDKILGFISDRPQGYPNGTLQGTRSANLPTSSSSRMKTRPQQSLTRSVTSTISVIPTTAAASIAPSIPRQRTSPEKTGSTARRR